jgi:ankyrin repeat protein
MKTFFSIIVAMLVLLAPAAFAKRGAPAEVKPVVHEGIEYRAPHSTIASEKMGVVEAWDKATGKMLWEKKVYTVALDADLEEDVQHVFITKLEIDAGKLIVTNERKDRYSIDLKTQKVTPEAANQSTKTEMPTTSVSKNDKPITALDDIALYDAVRSYDTPKVAALLRGGADPNILNQRGESLAITLLIPEEMGPRVVNSLDESGGFPKDIEKRRLEILHELINHRLDVNGGSDSPLKWAIHYHDYAIVELLVKSGADVNSRDSLGETPFSMIFSRSVYAENSSIERLRVAKLLVSNGLKPNMPDDEGRCALSQAIDRSAWEKNSIELFVLLLDAGADPNSLDRFRETPLHLAVKKFLSVGVGTITLDTIELLLKRGANPNIPTFRDDPKTPKTLIQEYGFLLTYDRVSNEDKEKARSVIALLQKYGGKETLD